MTSYIFSHVKQQSMWEEVPDYSSVENEQNVIETIRRRGSYHS